MGEWSGGGEDIGEDMGGEKMSDGWMVFLFIHHWVMLHSEWWLRPPGGLWGRLCVCLLAPRGRGITSPWMAVNGTAPHIGLIEGNWWPISRRCQSLWRSQWTCCELSLIQEEPNRETFCIPNLIRFIVVKRIKNKIGQNNLRLCPMNARLFFEEEANCVSECLFIFTSSSLRAMC